MFYNLLILIDRLSAYSAKGYLLQVRTCAYACVYTCIYVYVYLTVLCMVACVCERRFAYFNRSVRMLCSHCSYVCLKVAL